jgi:hypothetical protein
MHKRTAAALAAATLAAASASPVLAPASALAQQSPAPSSSSTPLDCSQVPKENGGCASPSPTPTANCPYVEFSVDRHVITPGQTVTVTARRVLGAPDQTVEARLSRRFPAPAALVRSDTSTATVVTWPLRLGESHRFLTEYPPTGPRCFPLGRPNGIPLQVDVQPLVSINAVRNAPRDYTFSGRVIPARSQRVTLWRVERDGRRVLTGTGTVAADGSYRFARRFTGSGRFGFQVDVAATDSNLFGRSAVRPTVVH